MPKPRKLLKRVDNEDGYIYMCPYCWRYVMRSHGLQQCLKCGGMVDNDNVEIVPGTKKAKYDGQDSWRR